MAITRFKVNKYSGIFIYGQAKRNKRKMEEKKAKEFTYVVEITDELKRSLTSETKLVVEGQGTIVRQSHERIFAPEPRLGFLRKKNQRLI